MFSTWRRAVRPTLGDLTLWFDTLVRRIKITVTIKYCQCGEKLTKYKCIICSAPVCNWCSVFEDDEEVDGWRTWTWVCYCNDCGLREKPNRGALLQETVSILYFLIFLPPTLIDYLHYFNEINRKNVPHVTHDTCALVTTDQKKPVLATSN